DAAVRDPRADGTDLAVLAERAVDADDGVARAFPVADRLRVGRGDDDERAVAGVGLRRLLVERHEERSGRRGVVRGPHSGRGREDQLPEVVQRQLGGGVVNDDPVRRATERDVAGGQPGSGPVRPLGEPYLDQPGLVAMTGSTDGRPYQLAGTVPVTIPPELAYPGAARSTV